MSPLKSAFAGPGRNLLPWLLVVVLATAVTFSPVLGNGFSDWDDGVYVTGNPLVTRLSWGGVGRIFATPVSGNYHPLSVLSHAVQYRLFADDPRFHHGVSLLLHLCAAALTFRVLVLLSGERLAALVGALFFALHPMRVESVAWITDQKDLLAAVFALGALVVYADPGWAKRRRREAAVFALFVAALLCKATVAVLPLALLLVDHLRGRLDRAAWRQKAPLFAAAAAAGVVAVAARWSYQGVLQERAPAIGSSLSEGLYRLLCYYLARSVAPFTDAFPLYPPSGPASGAGTRTLVLALAAAALAALVAFSLRRTRKVFFGVAFFVLALLPSLPLEVLGFSADRFSYLPAVGLAFLAGEGAVWLRGRLSAVGPALPAAGVICLAAICAALATGSYRQAQAWRTSETLWTRALDLYPAVSGHGFNRAHAHYNRGLARQKAGDLDGALSDLDAAVALLPERADFLSARGMIRAALGDPTAAEADFSRAIGTGGGVVPLIERGILRTRARFFAGAAADFDLALQIDPANAPALLNLGILHLESGEHEAARSAFTRLLDRHPGSAAALYGRAVAGAALGDYQQAANDAIRAEALGYPVAAGFLEDVRRQSGRGEAAPRLVQP